MKYYRFSFPIFILYIYILEKELPSLSSTRIFFSHKLVESQGSFLYLSVENKIRRTNYKQSSFIYSPLNSGIEDCNQILLCGSIARIELLFIKDDDAKNQKQGWDGTDQNRQSTDNNRRIEVSD